MLFKKKNLGPLLCASLEATGHGLNLETKSTAQAAGLTAALTRW